MRIGMVAFFYILKAEILSNRQNRQFYKFKVFDRETAAAPTFGSSGGYSDRFGLRTGGGFGDTSEYMFKSIIGSG